MALPLETAPVMPPAHAGIGLRSVLAPWLLLAVGCAGEGAGPVDGRLTREPGAAPLAILTLREAFGVSHPEQLVEFVVPAATTAAPVRLTDLAGRDVPAQVLRDGRLAVLTDLPAFGERHWILQHAAAPLTLEDGVRVTVRRAYYEVTNGLTGVRIARFPGNLSRVPAPIQGLRHRDGTWAATGPNYLEDAAGRALIASAAEVRFVERGPLKVVAEVTYRFRSELAPGEARPSPSYRSTIEVQARQPVVLVEDETELDLRYRLDVHEGLHPDQARYRGHYATSPKRGREPDGRQYRRGHERPAMDAVVDLPGAQAGGAGAIQFRGRLAVWDPWIGDGGWYWQLYDSRGPAEANLLGVFAGRASRAVGATESGIRVLAGPPRPDGTTPEGLLFEANHRTSDGRVFPRVRVAWGVFVGTKGRDLADPLAVQTIGRQMNLHAGMGLNKLPSTEAMDPSRLDLPGGLYLDAGRTKALADRVSRDEAFYRWLYQVDSTARPLLDLWRAPSDARRAEMAGAIADAARNILEALVHGGGIYDSRAAYWLGGLTMTRLAPWMTALLADPRTTRDDRARIAAAAALFGAVLWDDDVVPLFAGHGLHLGTENMPVQQREYRNQYALLLRNHPGMAARAGRVPGETVERLHAVVDADGAHMSPPHYVSASMGPLLTTLQQLKTAGADLFADARLGRFGEFLLNLLSPPEPRFGGLRKLVSIGDGATESCDLCGQLGTGLAQTDHALSRRLMGAWRASGEPHSGFFGTSIVKIDAALPGDDPALTSRSFPGWYSVLRSGWGTPEETALWLVHGSTYRDHYHDDNGSLVAYVLGAPMILDWGSFGAPRAAGGVMHSVLLPERLFGHPWDRGGLPLDAGLRWAVSGPPQFAVFDHSAHAAARFALTGHAWVREVALIHADPKRPIILIRDRLVDGPGSPAGNVLSLNLAAEGPVQTPAGAVLPPPVDPTRGELPSAGRVFGLNAGWSHLAFTGQWGVDWDLFLWLPAKGQAHIGQWAHAWHPGREAGEFQRAQGRRFTESQYVLRVLGTTAFDVVLVPRRKGATPDSVIVRDRGDAVELVRAASRLRLHESGYVLDDAERLVVTAVGEAPLRAAGVAVAGGATEIAVTRHSVRVTPRGPAGRRWIHLPGDCVLEGLAPASGGVWVVEHTGGEPVQVSGTCGTPPLGLDPAGPGPAAQSGAGAG